MSNKQEAHDKLKDALYTYLEGREDAFKWLMDFRQMCHALDDIIDIPERRADNQFIGLVVNQYVEVFSADFYSARRHKLYAIAKSCHHFYFTSVKWENNSQVEEWKRTYADVIRCCTNHMVVAVVECIVLERTGSIKAAYEAGNAIAELSAIKSWGDHHDQHGNPI